MNKTEFINTLTNTLKERKIIDVDEIIAEYEQHFVVKMADGYSEEEIAARLGDPKTLGNHFDLNPNQVTKGNKVITVIGLTFVDFMFSFLFVLMFTWIIIMGVMLVVFFLSGFLLIFNLTIYNFLPDMPYLVSFFLL